MRGSRAFLAGALAAAFLGAALHCGASGGSESGSSGVSVYVLGAYKGELDFLSSSGGVQLVLPAYLWSSFELMDGGLSTSTDRVVSIRSVRRGEITEIGGTWVREIIVEIVDPAPAGRDRDLRVRIDLADLVGPDGAISMQPGQAALREGVRRSGATSGMVRVRSIRLAGDTFVAGVEIR